MTHEDLIDEIERDAIDHNTPIGVALRKCVILEAGSGSEALTTGRRASSRATSATRASLRGTE